VIYLLKARDYVNNYIEQLIKLFYILYFKSFYKKTVRLFELSIKNILSFGFLWISDENFPEKFKTENFLENVPENFPQNFPFFYKDSWYG
jgi:hypothetical protein